MNYTKTDPKGIDKPIQRIQEKLYKELGYQNMDGYGRIYTLDRKGKAIPAYFIEGKDYKEVLTDDKKDAQFFFVENERTTFDSPQGVTQVDIIFLLNLNKIKPSVPHRADEEARVEIQEVLDKIKFFPVSEIIKGPNALNGFDTDLIDMQPYCFLKFTGTLRYQFNC